MTRRTAPAPRDLAETARAMARRGPLLVGLDFDGTLTEIVDDPGAPDLSPARRKILARVPSSGRWLAVVSGRALADVRERVGIDAAIVVGNHGLEIQGGGLSLRLAPEGTEARLAALLAALPLEGVVLENKTVTATLHVRPRHDGRRHAEIGGTIREAVEAAGFALRPGKAAWEIRPAGAAHKGDAIRRLLAELPGADPERAIYVGDDRTDEDAFLALPEGLTARVGPPGVETAARHRLPDPAAVYRFLEALIAG